MRCCAATGLIVRESWHFCAGGKARDVGHQPLRVPPSLAAPPPLTALPLYQLQPLTTRTHAIFSRLLFMRSKSARRRLQPPTHVLGESE